MPVEFVDTTQMDHRMVELADRAGSAPFEFTFDGHAWRKPAGKAAWHLPRYVASWLLKHDRDKVWTTDQGYVHRFGLGANDDDLQRELIGELGKGIETITPITINTKAIEGWSLDGATPRNRPGTEVHQIQGATLAQRERLGGSAVPAFTTK